MIVVADTSPINYLILIDRVHVLPMLYGTVLAPRAVISELRDPRSPAKLLRWMDTTPTWLEIVEATPTSDPCLLELGEGEREAIQVALVHGISHVLMDEFAGRAVATGLALKVEGTLRILERAAHLGILDFREALRQLEATNFRMSSSTRAMFLARHQ